MARSVILILIIVGLIQAFFLVLSLPRRKQQSRSNLYLALLILTYSTVLVQKYLVGTDWVLNNLAYFFITFSTPLLIGPFFFLYVKSSIAQSKFYWRSFLHFLPFFGFLLYFFGHSYIYSIHSLHYKPGETPSFISALGSIKAIHVILYGIASFYVTRKSKKSPHIGRLNPTLHTWINVFLVAYLATWLIGVFSFIAGHFELQYASIIDDLPILFLVALLYGVSFAAIRYPLVFDHKLKHHDSKLSSKDLDLMYARLMEEMDRSSPHLTEDLRLPQLAKQLEIGTNDLSRVINEKEGKNFQDFINSYRARDLQRKLLEPGSSHKKILAIAYEVGFGSKTVMNRAFKKETGLTPSEYLKNNS